MNGWKMPCISILITLHKRCLETGTVRMQFCRRHNIVKNGESERRSMIFETVLSTDNKVDFIRRAKDTGFFVRTFFVSTASPKINASRIAQRVMKGGHDVPITKIISRYSRSILNCADISKTVDRTYVYDNSIDNAEA